MTPHQVNCRLFKKELKGLEKPPFPGPVGLEIYEQVSQLAWAEWLEMQTKIINEYRLDLSESEDRQKLMTQMRRFLKFEENTDGQDVLKVGTPTL